MTWDTDIEDHAEEQITKVWYYAMKNLILTIWWRTWSLLRYKRDQVKYYIALSDSTVVTASSNYIFIHAHHDIHTLNDQIQVDV